MTLTEIKRAVFVNDPVNVHIVDLQIGLYEIAQNLEHLLGAVDAGVCSPLEIANRIKRMLATEIGS